MRMADTPNDLFEKEMALVKMWMDGEVEFGDLPADVQDALTEVFSEEPSEEPMEVAEPVVEEQFVKQEAVQHLDLLHKANDEHRFTLGPWYIPNRYDAHGEWTDANELQSALWDYVKSGDRDIRLQHNKDIVAGEWLEAMSFPVPVTIGMKKASSNEQVVYPSGTVFLGVQWKPWAWDMVKEGKIRGFSIGGAAARVEMAMPEDLEKASFGGNRSEAGRYAAYVRWRSKAHSIAQGTANLKAGLDRQQPKGDKPNITQRIKEYFTTMPTPYRQEEDRLLRERRRANENFVDDTKVEAVSLPSGRTAIMQGKKLTTTKFPASGMTASSGRPLRSPKPKTKPTGKRQKQWLESGYGGRPKVKQQASAVGKSDDSLRFKAIVDAKIASAVKKSQPTSSAVHVDTIMGGNKKKKKKRSKIMVDDVEKRGGLDKWFDEKWVDISRKKEGGGYEECGRPDATEGKYPKCVPASTASSMSESERKSAVSRKRKAERKGNREDKKPINVKTFTKSKNVPTNKELYSRVKAEAKKKFDVYPSAYANAWLVREYKSRGGKYRVVKASSPAWQRDAGKNPKGGLNAKGRASYKRETGGTLKPPVKRGDNPRRASFLARMGNAKGPERDEKGNPTRLLLSLQAWGANSKIEARKKAKAISARNKGKDVEKASFGGDRSAAGTYAANIRWMRSHINSMGKEFGVGEFGRAKTADGKVLEDLMPSLATHCDMDALATSVRERNLDGKNISNFADNLDAPAIVYQFLSAERKQVWDKATSDAVRGVPQGKNPDGSVVYLKAGGGGAGKSSTPDIEGVTIPHYGSTLNGNPEKQGENFQREAVMSNADDVKEILPAWSQSEKHSKTKSEIINIQGKDTQILKGKAMDRRAAFVHEESSMIASLIVTQAIQAGQDLIVDGTLDNGVAKSMGKIASYRDNGASKVNLIVYTCDTDEAETRSHKRSVETGRNVPVDHLRKAHIKVSENFPTYLEKGGLDSVTIIDTNRNTDGSRRPSEKIFEFKPSGGIKILNQALYDRFIDKRNDSVESTLDREDIVEEYKASGGQ
jgi:hypothetical protein